MNCYDCSRVGVTRGAVAVCIDCGAAVCLEHTISEKHWLTRMQVILRVERVDPPGRLIRCRTCHAAHEALGDVAETA
jgi:hypothetical protein